MTTPPEPLVGWRVWRLRGRELASWATAYVWRPNTNTAGCLKPASACTAAPGEGCKCGFWGLYSRGLCLWRARQDHDEPAPVVGLIRAWGEVAVHEQEGFRAQYAAPVCLFTDWIWGPPDPLGPETRRPARWWQAFTGLVADDSQAPGPVPDLDGRIRIAADEYGIPALSVADALRVGALQEMGVDARCVP